MLTTPLVYVAGPYGDASGYTAIDRNIAVARDACKWLVENGFFFLCPHMNSAHFEVITPNVPVEHWYEQDIKLLKKCDAMVLVGDWQTSRGVGREIEVARQFHIPVFDLDGRKGVRDRSMYGGEDPRAALLALKALHEREEREALALRERVAESC